MSKNRLGPPPSQRPGRDREDWRPSVVSLTQNMIVFHADAEKDGDPAIVPHPARLIDAVTNDAESALSRRPDDDPIFRIWSGGLECCTSAGMFRYAICRFVPGWRDPATAEKIRAVVRETLESLLGELRDKAALLPPDLEWRSADPAPIPDDPDGISPIVVADAGLIDRDREAVIARAGGLVAELCHNGNAGASIDTLQSEVVAFARKALAAIGPMETTMINGQACATFDGVFRLAFGDIDRDDPRVAEAAMIAVQRAARTRLEAIKRAG